MYRFIFLFLPLFLLAEPTWLYNIKTKHQNEIIGYGVDTTLHQAKQNAIEEIVKTISVSVDSRTNIKKSQISGKYNKDISMNLETKSKATLSYVSFIEVDQIEDTWYVAAVYDNSNIEYKIKSSISSNLEEEKQNNYLKYTPLIKSINNTLNKKLNFKLIRKNNLWQLKYKNSSFPLNEEDFYKLFVNVKNKNISINSNQSIYKENDEMFFSVDVKKKGYISILYVEYNGKVGIVVKNKKAYKAFTYPKKGETFKIVNPYGKPIQELYLIIYSKTKLDFADCETIQDSLLDESNYNFDKLINKLDTLEFSSHKIKIKK